MRPLLITDGAHLKGTYKGTNLVLVGMDGNNQIVPIATGVSQGETGESWTWHLMMNCKMKSDKLQAIYWKTCKAYTLEEFQRRVSDLRGFRPEAYKKLEEAGFETWSRAMCPATHKVIDRMQKSAHWKVLEIDYGRLYQVDDRRRVDQVDLTFRTCTCRKWQLSEEPSSWVRPDGLQVIKPPNMNFRTAGIPKNTDRIKSQREEPIQDSTQPRLKKSRQTRQESNIHVYLGGHSQEYEVAYTNNYVRSQEYEAAYINNYVRSQEYEAAYTNNYVRSQEYEAAYTNNYARSQKYEVAYTNNYVSTQENEAAYNNIDGGSHRYRSAYNNTNGSSQGYEAAYTNFNSMFEQANINFGGQSQHTLPTMPFTFSQFNLGQSSQQTYST
ncbi:transposase, MuDR, MULE transposase domain protein [Tanacetum coccineum]